MTGCPCNEGQECKKAICSCGGPCHGFGACDHSPICSCVQCYCVNCMSAYKTWRIAREEELTIEKLQKAIKAVGLDTPVMTELHVSYAMFNSFQRPDGPLSTMQLVMMPKCVACVELKPRDFVIIMSDGAVIPYGDSALLYASIFVWRGNKATYPPTEPKYKVVFPSGKSDRTDQSGRTGSN